MDYHLAEINIARMLDEIDSPIMAEFAANLERINALAEQSPGFVWRLKTDAGDATSIRVYEDRYLIVNLSVWESLEALREFTYYSAHTDYFRRRREWFEKLDIPALALWWVPAGHVPSVEEAKTKLELMAQRGATPQAFTFKERFSVEAWLTQNAEKIT